MRFELITPIRLTGMFPLHQYSLLISCKLDLEIRAKRQGIHETRTHSFGFGFHVFPITPVSLAPFYQSSTV